MFLSLATFGHQIQQQQQLEESKNCCPQAIPKHQEPVKEVAPRADRMMPINGSLSSGSNSSIDELASDAEQTQQDIHSQNHHNTQNHSHHHHQHHHQHQHHHHHHHHQTDACDESEPTSDHNHNQMISPGRAGGGLSRSASRVSRFRSAKEFFERLSSVSQSPSNHALPAVGLQNLSPIKSCKQSPERYTRGNVALRYIAPLAAHNCNTSSSNPNLTASPQLIVAAFSQETPCERIIASTPLAPTKQRRPFTIVAPSPPTSSKQQQKLQATTNTITSNNNSSPLSDRTQQFAGQRQQLLSANATSSPLAASSPDLAAEPTTVTPARPRSLPPRARITERQATPATSSSPQANQCSQLSSSWSSLVSSPSVTATISSPSSSSSSSAAAAAAAATVALANSCSSASSSSSYVRLKTTDTSGLSTNTILHINNSHLSCNGRGADSSKSVIISCEPALDFEGDNVIVGTGSLLVRRNKQLRITFDESTTATFEYPPEELSSCSSWDSESTPANGSLEENGQISSEQPQQQATISDQPHQAKQQPTSKQATAATTTTLNSIDKLTNGLSNYKPSSLMMETTKNLDNQLGVKKLVPIHNSTKVNIVANSNNTATLSTVNKLRQSHSSSDHWSSNNGSVIYAQPTTNFQRSNKYLKSTNGTQNVLVESKKVDGNQGSSTINNILNERNALSRAASQYKGFKLAKDTNGIGGDDLSGEDLNNRTESVSKWSNGSGTTSDLLF